MMRDNSTTNSDEKGQTHPRRRFLKIAGATAGGAAIVGAGAVAAQSGGSSGMTDIQLGGKTAGWQGKEPDSISGSMNPTLKFVAGQKIAVTWKNVDGAPHNFQVMDSNGKVLHKTELMSEKGSSQTTSFTATKKMTEYNCVAHPASMRGDVNVSEGSGQDTTQGTTENETTENETTENETTENETTENETTENETTENETTENETTERPEPADTPTQTFKIAFEDGVWTGQSPSTIKGESNPTLKLKTGDTYRVTWENHESISSPTNQRPNFTILSSKDEVNDVVRTAYLSKKGATQTVNFVATSDLSSYLAEAYPNAEGKISVSEGMENQQQGNGKAKTGNGKAKTGNGKAKTGNGNTSDN